MSSMRDELERLQRLVMNHGGDAGDVMALERLYQRAGLPTPHVKSVLDALDLDGELFIESIPFSGERVVNASIFLGLVVVYPMNWRAWAPLSSRNIPQVSKTHAPSQMTLDPRTERRHPFVFAGLTDRGHFVTAEAIAAFRSIAAIPWTGHGLGSTSRSLGSLIPGDLWRFLPQWAPAKPHPARTPTEFHADQAYVIPPSSHWNKISSLVCNPGSSLDLASECNPHPEPLLAFKENTHQRSLRMAPWWPDEMNFQISPINEAIAEPVSSSFYYGALRRLLLEWEKSPVPGRIPEGRETSDIRRSFGEVPSFDPRRHLYALLRGADNRHVVDYRYGFERRGSDITTSLDRRRGDGLIWHPVMPLSTVQGAIRAARREWRSEAGEPLRGLGPGATLHGLSWPGMIEMFFPPSWGRLSTDAMKKVLGEV